jgi:hypothetical protein
LLDKKKSRELLPALHRATIIDFRLRGRISAPAQRNGPKTTRIPLAARGKRTASKKPKQFALDLKLRFVRWCGIS